MTEQIKPTASLLVVGFEQHRFDEHIGLPRILLQWHNKRQRWIQPGGHSTIETSAICGSSTKEEALATALREFSEETELPTELLCIQGLNKNLLDDDGEVEQLPNPYARFQIKQKGIDTTPIVDEAYFAYFARLIMPEEISFETIEGTHKWHSLEDISRLSYSEISSNNRSLAQQLLLCADYDQVNSYVSRM